MSEAVTALGAEDLSLTAGAQAKFTELMQQVDDHVAGVRVFASPGGCSGVSFGMNFTDQINAEEDGVLQCEGFQVIVDQGTLQYLKGVEIDFVDRGDGNASFVFNNLPSMGGGGGCGGCSSSQSQGGGCS
ncbi:MAG: iron-sulfur cluster assembly accessory protein [Gammaproteobacteria bacterium SHHR-1]|uniref:HesB/IscA family protein n=1 Tax=Magnetovirga frankeli TaxID=947516 RepID=UPI001293ACB7|nr:iron-sulfur cluster assembly accessory protein [gamma proteobacterium SS-5]